MMQTDRSDDLRNRLSFLNEQVGQLRALVVRLQQCANQPDLRIIADELAFELDGVTQSVSDLAKAVTSQHRA